MDFHVPDLHEIMEIVLRFPVLLVATLGQVFGGSFTQIVKKTYLAWANGSRVSEPRYRASVRWLSVLSTYFFTVVLWHQSLPHTGYEEIASVGLGFLSPLLYDLTKMLVRWKFPDFAASWGDNPKPPKGDSK